MLGRVGNVCNRTWHDHKISYHIIVLACVKFLVYLLITVLMFRSFCVLYLIERHVKILNLASLELHNVTSIGNLQIFQMTNSLDGIVILNFISRLTWEIAPKMSYSYFVFLQLNISIHAQVSESCSKICLKNYFNDYFYKVYPYENSIDTIIIYPPLHKPENMN